MPRMVPADDPYVVGRGRTLRAAACAVPTTGYTPSAVRRIGSGDVQLLALHVLNVAGEVRCADADDVDAARKLLGELERPLGRSLRGHPLRGPGAGRGAAGQLRPALVLALLADLAGEGDLDAVDSAPDVARLPAQDVGALGPLDVAAGEAGLGQALIGACTGRRVRRRNVGGEDGGRGAGQRGDGERSGNQGCADEHRDLHREICATRLNSHRGVPSTTGGAQRNVRGD